MAAARTKPFHLIRIGIHGWHYAVSPGPPGLYPLCRATGAALPFVVRLPLPECSTPVRYAAGSQPAEDEARDLTGVDYVTKYV
jgi:hypothetical protein